MNLPNEPQMDLRPRKVFFQSSYMYVSPVEIGGQLMTGVLLDKSDPTFSSQCYQSIWRKIKVNEKLRFGLTKSLAPISLKQVIAVGGYGIVTTSTTEPGLLAHLSWHPRIKNRIEEVGMRILIPGLGQIVSSPAA